MDKVLSKILGVMLLMLVAVTGIGWGVSKSLADPLLLPATGAPLLQQDMIGSYKNYYPNRVRGFVFGHTTNINNVRVDLWEGPTTTYVFPTSAMQMKLVSTSANDTGAGTGAQRVEIHYLDANYNPAIEIVTLNGITAVNTVATNILRINAMHVVQDGTGGAPAGNISLTNTAGTVTYAFITAGFNTARQAIYTVPAGMWGYISHWQASSGSAGNHFCNITLRASTHTGLLWPGVYLVQDETGTQNGPAVMNFPTPIPIPPTADVKVSAICDASNAAAQATGSIMGWFEQ